MPKKHAFAACFFLLNVLLVGCTKDTLTPEVTPVPETTTIATATATDGNSSSGYASYSPSSAWKNRANGTNYGFAEANADFKNVVFWGGGTRNQIVNGMLRTTLAKNTLAEGGNISRIDVADGSEYQVQFDMMFDQNFDFSWGGKVGFGFLVGNGYTGGVPGTDGNGGSFRLMWYKNTSAGRVFLKPYVYYKDQPGTYGNDFGKTFPATGSIQKGVWYTVKMYIKSNTGSNTDGRVRMTINGTTLIDQPIRWTTNDVNRMVKHICFETFRGGGETYWQSSTDGDIYFDNVSWTALQ